MSLTAQQRLAAFVADASELPEAARDIARQSLLDSLAVAFAGRDEAVHGRVRAYLDGAEPHGSSAWRWLDGGASTPELAAFANAVAVHALDYDDVTPAWRGHPGTVIWPAILALARPEHSYGDLLDAFVLGFEAGAQIGEGIVAHHYGAGWHSTATVGVLAAAAATARVLGLDATQTCHALGLAVAQASGVQGNFGTMAKPMQAGFAASAAVRAALLARSGVEAGDVLEGGEGFLHLYGGTDTLDVHLPTSFDGFAILRRGIEVKQFPNCYATHRAIEAALLLRQDLTRAERSRQDAVRSILVEGTKGAHRPLLMRAPTSVEESRFSVEYAVACALVDGGLRLSTFAPGDLERPAIRNLMAMTSVRESLALGSVRAARITIELAEGSTLQSTVTALPGTYGDAVFMDRLRGKLADCLGSVGLGGFAIPLWDRVIEAPAGQALELESTLSAMAVDLRGGKR